MALDTSKLVTALGAYFRANNKTVRSWIYQEPELFKYTVTVPKVKGEFPVNNTIWGRVTQGFASTWNAVGDMSIKPNILKAYDHKVNVEIKPDDLEATWLAELNTLGVPAEQRPITMTAMQDLQKAVARDVNWLTGRGVRNAAALGTFGNSMNGLEKLIADGRIDQDNPMYQINGAALTDDNIVDVVDSFDIRIPSEAGDLVDTIFISKIWLAKYRSKLRRLNLFSIGEGDFEMTLSGRRKLVGLSCLDGTDVMFATVSGNMVKLVDNDQMGGIDFVRPDDYVVKVALRWYLGIGFLTNQLVFVRVNSTSGSGLVSGNTGYYA